MRIASGALWKPQPGTDRPWGPERTVRPNRPGEDSSDLDIAGSGASLVHLRVPERFVLDEDARIECGEGCSIPAHFEAGADGAPGSLEADVPLPPELGGPHHVVHVHAPAEITEGDCH